MMSLRNGVLAGPGGALPPPGPAIPGRGLRPVRPDHVHHVVNIIFIHVETPYGKGPN
jgi:hypothetical protein